MKKIILSLLLSGISAFVFGQSIVLTPTTTDSQIIKQYSTSDGPNLAGVRARGTAASPTAVSSGDNLLTLQGRGYYSGSFTSDIVGIVFDANQNFSNTAHGTNIQFYTTANNTTFPLERLRIAHDGNIGIGTTIPETKLHIYNGYSGVTPNSGGTFTPTFFMERNGHNYLELASPDANERGIVFSNPANGGGGGIYYNSNKMSFRTNSNTTKMTIDATGNVGIGVGSPTAKLHVDGDFALKKKVLLSGNGGHSNFDREGASIISIATPANGGGGETLGGIADGVDGLIIHVYPVQGTSLTLAHENTGSLAANRIITNSASNISIINNGGATLMYDASVSRWRVIGIAN